MNGRFLTIIRLLGLIISLSLIGTNAFALIGIDDYTVLMLHFNGDDASTEFIDDSSNSHTVTGYRSAQLDTARKRFGSASAKFFGNKLGDYLAITDSDDWYFGSGDFTIDFWVYLDTIGNQWDSEAIFVSQHFSTDTYWKIDYHSGMFWFFANVIDGPQQIGMHGGPMALPETWYHIAVVRYGNNWNYYLNGVSVASTVDSDSMPDFNAPLTIGGNDVYINQNLTGWIDEFRISKGIARWTSDFAPPTEEYEPVSEPSTMLLLGLGLLVLLGLSKRKKIAFPHLIKNIGIT